MSVVAETIGAIVSERYDEVVGDQLEKPRHLQIPVAHRSCMHAPVRERGCVEHRLAVVCCGARSCALVTFAHAVISMQELGDRQGSLRTRLSSYSSSVDCRAHRNI